MFIRQRISAYLNLKGITRYKFYKKTGLSNGFLDKAGSINSDNCAKICDCYADMSPEWLITEKGPMFRINSTSEIPEADHPTLDVLVQKIVDLSAENSLLKKEIETLRTKLGLSEFVVHKSIDEDDRKNDMAAEPLK